MITTGHLRGALCAVFVVSAVGLNNEAAAQRDRPVIVRMHADVDREEALTLWNGGLGRSFDLLAYDPASADAPNVAGTGLTWWIHGLEGLSEALETRPGHLAAVVYDLSRPELAPASERENLEETARTLTRLTSKAGVRSGVVLGRDTAQAVAPAVTPHVDLCLVEIASADAAGADQARRTAIQINALNRKARVGVYLPRRPGEGGYDAESLLTFYEETHAFLHFYAMDWGTDPEAFARVLLDVSLKAPSTPASQGMYANTMQAPLTPLDPAVERRLRLVLSISSVIFIAAVIAFVKFYKVPRRSGAPPPG